VPLDNHRVNLLQLPGALRRELEADIAFSEKVTTRTIQLNYVVANAMPFPEPTERPTRAPICRDVMSGAPGSRTRRRPRANSAQSIYKSTCAP
jgi:hypothetical protein